MSGAMVVPDSGTSRRRYGILDSPLQTAFSDGWRDRGIDSPADMMGLEERGVAWVACDACDSCVNVRMSRWFFEGRVLVCLECGADLT
jgi:hypothetical protein